MNSNIDLIRAGYADFQNQNIAGVISRFADEFAVDIVGAPEVPYAGTYRNPAELAGFFQELAAQVTISKFEPREYFADGDRVVAIGRYGGSVNRSGHAFETDFAMIWTVRDGKIVGMQELTDPSELKKGFA